jgi:hypothetical protein
MKQKMEHERKEKGGCKCMQKGKGNWKKNYKGKTC